MRIKDKNKCNEKVPFWNDNPHFNSLADKEGWGLFHCSGSKHGIWQI